jgi:hypothetical protein
LRIVSKAEATASLATQIGLLNRVFQMPDFRQAIVWGCIGWISACPNVNFGVRSNALPLAFGMTPEVAAAALESPLAYVSGRRDSDIYYAEKTAVATGFIVHQRERLWLQFRHRRLTGWKYDWDRPMTW